MAWLTDTILRLAGQALGQPEGAGDERSLGAVQAVGRPVAQQPVGLQLPAMAEHVLATCPSAEPSWYEGVGHTAHLEAPGRFNRELAALTRRVRA